MYFKFTCMNLGLPAFDVIKPNDPLVGLLLAFPNLVLRALKTAVRRAGISFCHTEGSDVASISAEPEGMAGFDLVEAVIQLFS